MDYFDYDRHDREHEEPRSFKDDCDICEARFEERKANGEYDDIIVVPAPGTIGIGVGYIDHDDESFHSVVWFPETHRDDAAEFADHIGYIVREGVAL